MVEPTPEKNQPDEGVSRTPSARKSSDNESHIEEVSSGLPQSEKDEVDNHSILSITPTSILQELDRTLATYFVEQGAQRLAAALVASFGGGQFVRDDDSNAWEYAAKTRLKSEAISIKTRIKDSLEALDGINDNLTNALSEDSQEEISQLIHSELSSQLEKVLTLSDDINEFNDVLYATTTTMLIEDYRKSLKVVGKLESTSDSEIHQEVADRLGVRRDAFLGPVREGTRAIINILRCEQPQENRDINSYVADLSSAFSFTPKFHKNEPTVLSNEAYLRLITGKVALELQSFARGLRSSAREELCKDNSIFKLLEADGFSRTDEATILSEFLSKPDELALRVGNAGELTFKMTIPKELEKLVLASVPGLQQKLKCLDDAISLSHSSLKVDYQSDWNELSVQAVFQAGFPEKKGGSYEKGQLRLILEREWIETHNVQEFEPSICLNRSTSFGPQSTEYSLMVSSEVLEDQKSRSDLLNSLTELDKYMTCFPRFHECFVSHQTEGIYSEMHEFSSDLVFFMRGHLTPADKERAEAPPSLVDLLEAVPDFGESSKGNLEKAARMGSVISNLNHVQLILDSKTLHDKEIGDQLASLDQEVDLLSCPITMEVFANLNSEPGASHATQAGAQIISMLEGLRGLVDSLYTELPSHKGKFKVFLPVLSRTFTPMTNEAEYGVPTSQSVVLVNIADENSLPLAKGFFDPEKSSLFYQRRNINLEHYVIGSVVKCVSRQDGRTPSMRRGADLVLRLEAWGVRLPIHLVQRFSQELPIAQFVSEVNLQEVAPPVPSPAAIRQELESVFALPYLKIKTDSKGVIHFDRVTAEDLLTAPRI